MSTLVSCTKRNKCCGGTFQCFHCPTLLSTTLPKTRSSTAGKSRGASKLLKLTTRGRNSWWKRYFGIAHLPQVQNWNLFAWRLLNQAVCFRFRQWLNREAYKCLGLPMPVSPSGVSGISARHFRNCRRFDKLWIFRVGPATFKYQTDRKSETQ